MPSPIRLTLFLLSIAAVVEGLNCSLKFLFIAEERIFNEHIWLDYFRGAANHGQARAFVYSTHPEQFKPPHYFRAAVVSGRHGGSRNNSAISAVSTCSSTFDGMVQLLSRAVNSDARHNSDAAYIFVSGDSIPVKSLADTYNRFCRSEVQQKGLLQSSICVDASTEWVEGAGAGSDSAGSGSSSSSQSSSKVVIHDPWMVLTHEDAVKVLSEVQSGNGPSCQTSLNSTAAALRPEYSWFYRLLRGTSAPEAKNGTTSASTISPSPPPMLDPNSVIEQGNCHTFYDDGKRSANGPFRAISNNSLSNGSYVVRDGLLVNITSKLLLDLHVSPNFYFARRFRGHDAGSFIRGSSGEFFTLPEAVKKLHLLSTNLHQQKNRRKGDNGGLRVLIVSADDREMKERLEDNDYVGMTAVLLEDYSRHHGYDFLKLTGNSTGLTDRVREKYNDTFRHSGGIGDTKYGPSCFHAGYLQFRASSWGKLPNVWHVVAEFGYHYDYVLYMDSDAAINPAHRNRSIYDSMMMWKSDNRSIYWGERDPFKSNLLLFSNFPWRDDLPCAGIFMVKAQGSEATLREWWDYKLESKNWADFMEQDALWYMLEADPKYGFLINKNTTSLLNEREFVSAYHGLNDLWLIHVPNYWPNRLTWFKQMLKLAGYLDPVEYAKAIERVRKHNYLAIDILAVAEAMDKLHPEPRRTMFPPEFRSGSKADDYWHVARNTHLRPPLPPPGKVLEGFAISVQNHKEWWYIENGTRRAFPNMQTFEKMGFKREDLLVFRQRDAQATIPFGSPLTSL